MGPDVSKYRHQYCPPVIDFLYYTTVDVVVVVVVYRKIRTRLDLLSIPQSGGKNVKTFRWDQRLQIQNLFKAFKRVPRWK